MRCCSEYREVVALNERAGHQTAWPLTNVADVQRMRGELDAARATCARAQVQAAPLTDPQFAVFSGFTCALIESDRGNADAARTGFAEVIRRVGTGGDMSYRDNSLMMLAQLDMDDGRWSAARERLQQASRGFAAAEERTGEADAEAMLALCEQALGNAAGRNQALQRARALRQSITSRQEVYVVDIALARLGDPAQSDTTSPRQTSCSHSPATPNAAISSDGRWRQSSPPGSCCGYVMRPRQTRYAPRSKRQPASTDSAES